MRTAIVLLATCLLASVARAESLESPDTFEAAWSKCLTTSATPAACFEKHISGRFPPREEGLDAVVTQVAELFTRWLGKDKVFAVHPVKSLRLGTYAERRVYVIEDTTGHIIMFDVAFARNLGSWYFNKVNLTTKSDEIKAALDGVL